MAADIESKMPHVLVDRDSRRILKTFANGSRAKAFITRETKKCAKRGTKMVDAEIMPTAKYNLMTPSTRTVKSLMNGQDVVIDFNASIGCDPSSETYWSM